MILLNGVRDAADRVIGLELGAGDYVTKQFSSRELLAQIRTELRVPRARRSNDRRPMIGAPHPNVSAQC